MESATPQQQRAYVDKMKQEVEVQQMQELVCIESNLILVGVKLDFALSLAMFRWEKLLNLALPNVLVLLATTYLQESKVACQTAQTGEKNYRLSCCAEKENLIFTYCILADTWKQCR